MAKQQIESNVAKKRRTANQLEDEERWNTLSTIVALEGKANGYHESHVDYSKEKGSLVVIGSGIKCVGQFSLEAISHLKNADKVLYCVADPATEHFIRELCPDALDLYVFYANGKKRYETYIQIAEATLYFARQGLRTVMVFYGHPGIFVMPSHRAIKIAQQQGIESYMLPAVSALDCLVADLGIDPSYPGMMTLEATDLLLRNRTLLTDLHIIIWQVGCVGDLGFVRTGYKNQFLSVLIEHIQGIYGKDYIITHYIGAQYPMCSPTIAKLPLSKILEPDTMKTITGISTFYIPPKVAKEIIPANAQQLDITLASDGSTESPLVRQYARCGPREKKAIHDLLDWKVPEDYNHSTFAKIGQYLGKLAQDVGLLQKHKNAPVKTMRKAGLATKEISTLLSASPAPQHKMMKSNANSVATQVVVRLLTDPKFASDFYAAMKKYRTDPQKTSKMNAWLALKGYNTTLTNVGAAFVNLKKTSLLPWTGKYTTNQSITLTIVGQAPSSSTPSKVLVDTTVITNFTFDNQTLTWSSSNGNSSSANLVFVDGGLNKLSFTGKYWPSTSQIPLAANISGQNSATKGSFSNWVGSYTSTLNAMTGPTLVVYAIQNSNYRVFIGNTEIFQYTFGSNNSLLWSVLNNTTNGEIVFSVQSAGTPQVRRVFSGYYWGKGSIKPQTANFRGVINVANFSPYLGMYSSLVVDSQGKLQFGPECFMASKSNNASFTIGIAAIKSPTYSNSTITWSTSGGNADNGTVVFYIDAKKHTPAFSGKRWTGSTVPTKNNFFGSLDSSYLQEWAGVYTTYTNIVSWSPGAQLIVNAAKTPANIQITYGSTAIKSPVFNNPVLTWSKSDGNLANAYIIFYYPKNSKIPKCYGKIWLDTKPTTDNFMGQIDSKYLQSWTGTYASYFQDSKGIYNVAGPQLSIFGALTESASTVFVRGQTITNFKYSTEGSSKYGYLKWSNVNNTTGGDITLYLDSSLVRSFSGYYWKQGEIKPTNMNWVGNTNPRGHQNQATTYQYSSTSGGSRSSNYFSITNIENAIGMGLIVMGAIYGLHFVAAKTLEFGKYAWSEGKKYFKPVDEQVNQQENIVRDENPRLEPIDLANIDAVPNPQVQGSALEIQAGITSDAVVGSSANLPEPFPAIANSQDPFLPNTQGTRILEPPSWPAPGPPDLPLPAPVEPTTLPSPAPLDPVPQVQPDPLVPPTEPPPPPPPESVIDTVLV